MEFRKVLALRGPNVWARFPVLEAWVDLGPLKHSPSNELPGFNDRLMAWLPTMIEHRCGLGYRGGFFERLRDGTYQGHILEHVTLELQTLAGTDVGFGKARETSEEGVYKVVVKYEDETLGRECLEVARRMLDAAVYDKPFDTEAELIKLRALKEKVCLGPSTGAIVAAAKKRGIPSRRLNKDSLVLLGFGSKQRRIVATETCRTGAIAEALAQDKEMTRALLSAVGVPVPRGRAVADAEDAWTAAQEIGGAVVVKPQYGNHGRGVTTNLTTRESVLAAYANALEVASSIMVESFAPGDDYRLFVVNNKVVAAAKRDPAQVVGDGVHTVRELVTEVNRDPRRGDDHGCVLTKITLDAIALTVLADQGFKPESIPATGQVVLIRRNANLSTGGTATDVTDEVHPDVIARAIDAARVIGLDVAGIDVIIKDIRRPMEEQGGIVCEVNAGPGLRMHLEPSVGQPRPVAEAIVEHLFPNGENGRIPIVAITGVNGKTTTTRLIAHLIGTTGKTVGMTCTDGIFVNSRLVDTGDCSGPASARSVLLNPAVDAAVLETARGGILREGLAFDLCDVAVVTNIGEGDHLGLSDVETVEKLATVKSTIVDTVAKTGHAVLNAADPFVAIMAESCRGSVVFFARSEANLVLAEHRSKGGKVAFVRDDSIILADGPDEIRLAPLAMVPLTHNGRVGFQIENALAASSAAWALGVPLDSIRNGLASFHNDDRQTPGRFNVLHGGGATVILDYGHNPSALIALVESLVRFPHNKLSTVFTAVGDRRDVDIKRLGEVLGHSFDRVVLFEDNFRRGRPVGQIIELLREGMSTTTRAREVFESLNEFKAIDIALDDLAPGHLLLIQPDSVEKAYQYVKTRLEGRHGEVVEQFETPVKRGVALRVD